MKMLQMRMHVRWWPTRILDILLRAVGGEVDKSSLALCGTHSMAIYLCRMSIWKMLRVRLLLVWAKTIKDNAIRSLPLRHDRLAGLGIWNFGRYAVPLR